MVLGNGYLKIGYQLSQKGGGAKKRFRNASELNSIRNGLIPRGRNLKRGRRCVFFTVTNPMEDDNGMEETPRDLTQPRIAPYRKYLETPSKYGKLVQFEAHSRESLAFLPHTHHMQLALRKRYVSKHMMSSFKRFA